MVDFWGLLILPLYMTLFHGVKSCLQCDPKFIEDIKAILGGLVPPEVPGRYQLLEQQCKEITRLSFKVCHSEKNLRLLAVGNVKKLRTWLTDEYYRLGNETWKGAFIFQGRLLEIRRNMESKMRETLKSFSEVACSEDCITSEGPTLDCWTCLRITTDCFRGDYCGDENPKKAENLEIALFLILLAEAVILAGAVLLFHFCISHRRKMKRIRRTLKKYLEKRIEELMGIADKEEEKRYLEPRKQNTHLGRHSHILFTVDSDLQTRT